MSQPSPNTPLLQGVSQYEVDFVIPRWGIDLPVGIDPFLLFKSRDPNLANLHKLLLDAFNSGIEQVREGKLDSARQIFDFPEVAEIGLGYTKKGKRGSGVGEYLTELIIQTLVDSPALVERGVRHIEEMQLVSVGIGPDRISDITASLLKQYLIDYTQKQCELWQIPLDDGVPVAHVFDADSFGWHDGYFDLPVSPFDNSSILLVPRRIVRTLPWINYEDFFRMEFSTYLRAKRVRHRLTSKKVNAVPLAKPDKEQIVTLTRTEIKRLDRYVSVKEATGAEAQPSQPYIDPNDNCPETLHLKERLAQVKVGREDASLFQRVVLEILNFLFNPELIDGELEVETGEGTERRDIVFTNDSDRSFWSYIRSEHSSIFLMFEVKNTQVLDNTYLNQVATYLGDRLGRLGFIVTRHPLQEAQEKKAFSIFNDSHPRKIILTLSDIDLVTMLDMKCQGGDPMKYIQKLYRSFRTKVQ